MFCFTYFFFGYDFAILRKHLLTYIVELYLGILTLRIIFACRNRYMCVKDKADRNRWLASILNMKVRMFVVAFIYM